MALLGHNTDASGQTWYVVVNSQCGDITWIGQDDLAEELHHIYVWMPVVAHLLPPREQVISSNVSILSTIGAGAGVADFTKRDGLDGPPPH
jgi:hypothetical protein